jgi:chromosomal replication initiation ATPase DnaA
MHLGGQLRLKLERAANFSRESFIVSASNRDAARTLDAWPAAGASTLALVGPPGSGKTHLAMAWAARTDAKVITPDDLADGLADQVAGALLMDDADRAPHGEAFFHLLNTALRPDCCLLMTGATAPKLWSVEVQDLRSRLNAVAVVEFGEPDDVILRGMLAKLFDERNITPPQELVDYLLRRMERSASAAGAIVKALDEAASAEGRPVSRVLARQLLKDDGEDAPGLGSSRRPTDV